MSGFASNPVPGAFQTISIETGSPVEWSEEQNYMFRLSSFRDDLLHYYRFPSKEHISAAVPRGNTEDVR
jgi:methionyl-tRNA synthetase